jgi:hypothetical protein
LLSRTPYAEEAVMTSEHKDEEKRFVETARRSREQLEKQGTPEYDPREHMRVVEEHRKLGEQLKEEEG